MSKEGEAKKSTQEYFMMALQMQAQALKKMRVSLSVKTDKIQQNKKMKRGDKDGKKKRY